MTEPRIAPYGSWKSPITSDLIVSKTISLSQVLLDGADTYWVEMRPADKARYVIVRRRADGTTTDITPAPYSVRSRANEYGGGAYVVAGGLVYFTNNADQRIYRQALGQEPQPLTAEANWRYADLVLDNRRRRLICVREDHTISDLEPENSLVSISLDGGQEQVLVSGNDFYASPRLSPDGQRLAWLAWDQPNMPWDGTELWLAEIGQDGSLQQARQIAGGPEESIFQPAWSPDGTLYFVSDRTGWWNLYRWQHETAEHLAPMEAEFGLPQWAFGMSTYTFEPAAGLICTYTEQGTWRLAKLDPASGRLDVIETPYTEISDVQAAPGRAVFLAGSPLDLTSVVQLDLATGRLEVLRRSGNVDIDPAYISAPQPVTFPTGTGAVAHAFYYPPKNRDYAAPAGEKPPLLVRSHGGPTGSTSSTLNLANQYWTSRGFALLDVDYRGSTGYGRAYRQQLNGQWGIADVEDCVNGALFLVGQGQVDGDRLLIRGGSAGGYTTLCALTFTDTFSAGASYYGVGDLELLDQDSHKFEARYNERLIGPYPERRDLYRERSPLHFTERLSCPVIFFQGLEDKVVPPNQAEMMVAALRAKGVPVAYLAFEHEQHGFRRAETIKRTLDAELYFYARVLGFELAEPVEPVLIENLT